MSERRTVMHQRTRAVRAAAPSTNLTELAEQTGVGEVLLDTLLRRQLRLGLRLLLFTAAPLVLLPLLVVVAPDLVASEVWGIGVMWWVLGGGVYPLMFVASRWYLRRAERNEREFVELVHRR
jgi:uncharacterized membrane protein (DUF485 family)